MTAATSMSSPSARRARGAAHAATGAEVERVNSIDTARGAAMLFVWLSHFAGAYLYPNGKTVTADLLIGASMIASPSFVMISGMVCGFLATMHPHAFPRLRRHLLDRGLFLLVVGHVLLALTKLPAAPNLRAALQESFITDSIALAIMIGPSLVATTPGWRRLVIATALYVTSWMSISSWLPFGMKAQMLKLYATGALGPAPHGVDPLVFPLIPWFAVYLVGTVVGERVGALYRRGELRRARVLLAGIGTASLMMGAGAYVLRRHLVARGLVWLRSPTVLELTRPMQKFPPGTAYLLFFGGAGLLVVALVLQMEDWRQVAWLTAFLRVIGRAALLVFFLQALFASILHRLALPYSHAWPLLYLGALLLLGAAARAWCGIDGNRYFTVGLRALLERRVERLARLAPSTPHVA